MGETEPQVNNLLLNQAISIKVSLYLIEMLATKIPWEPSNNSNCYENYRLLSSDWQHGSIVEDTTYVNMENICSNSFSTELYLCATKREI